jgi:hypothetical protein
MKRLEVFLIHSAVSDQRVSHGHDLPLVGGIGENFLIAGHGSIENHFPPALPWRAAGTSGENLSIFQDEKGFWSYNHDDLAKSQPNDGFVKSSRCQARLIQGVGAIHESPLQVRRRDSPR